MEKKGEVVAVTEKGIEEGKMVNIVNYNLAGKELLLSSGKARSKPH